MAIFTAPGQVTGSLHIPYPRWAYVPRSFAHYFEDLLAIQRWANTVECHTALYAPDELATLYDPRFDPLNRATLAFHFPHLESVKSDADGGYLEINYLAFERWAGELCHGLHIPYKQWMREDPQAPLGPDHELANLLAIERWAATIGPCCIETVDTGGGGG